MCIRWGGGRGEEREREQGLIIRSNVQRILLSTHPPTHPSCSLYGYPTNFGDFSDTSELLLRYFHGTIV